MLPLLQHESSIFWCDSISLKVLTMAFGYNVQWKPGTVCVDEIVEKADQSTTLILASHKGLKNYPAKVIELPVYSEKIYIPEDVKYILDEDFENIYIGISSPKQNLLSIELNKHFPNSNIHCAGAAVGLAFKSNRQRGGFDFSKTGFEWFVLFVKNPRRGVVKIIQTLCSIYDIFRYKNVRSDFKKFASKLE